MTPIVEFDAASKWYGNVIGLNKLTLHIPAGVTGLLGPNGAGKSTLLQLATGQLRPSQGIQSRTPAYRWRGEHLNAGWVTTFNDYAVISENRMTVMRAGGSDASAGGSVPGSVPGRIRGRRFHARNGEYLRRTGQFRYPCVRCLCSVDELRAHLKEKFGVRMP